MTRLHLMTWSLERSPVKSRLSRVPWSRSPRAPPVGASYTGASLRRSRSVPRPCVLYVQLSGSIIMLLFGRRGHRQISTVTRFQAHPSGFLHWSRSPRAPPIGAFYTGVLLAALSIGSSAGCTLRTVLHSSGGAVDRAGYSSALRQTRAQTNQYCNPNPGSPLWVLALGTRSSLSCGRWFLPHWRCPQSALGPVVSLAPSADRCLNPSFLPGCCPPSQASLSFTNSK